MYRYVWDAVQDDGSVISRYTAEGEENTPDPWYTRQFHLYSLWNIDAPKVSVFVPRGAYFTYFRRRLIGPEDEQVIYVVGWQYPDIDTGTYTYILPDHRIEMAGDTQHITRYERNLDVQPLTKWEGN